MATRKISYTGLTQLMPGDLCMIVWIALGLSQSKYRL